MSGKAAKVVLSERQQDILHSYSRSRTCSVRLQQRASLILLAFEGLGNEDIAPQVGLERHQVGRWRKRWQRAFDRLIRIECLDTPQALHQAIRQTLDDAPRPGAPGKFTAEQLAQIIACACEPPENAGRPISHWTVRELADEVRQRGIVASISESQLRRILRQAELQPHRSRYWLYPKDLEDPDFERQVHQVCDCYLYAPEWCYRLDTYTVCVDEKTGIQALERVAPDQGMQPGRIHRREFEYKRHGTQCLIGSFEVVSGQVLSPSVGPTRTEEDFVRHIEGTLAWHPHSHWVIIVDQLNTHCSEGLVRLVAKRCGIDEQTLGKKGQRGILRSLKSRQKFLSDTSHRIRFVYTPKHTSWLNQIEIWFSILTRRLLKRTSFRSTQDLKERILAFIDYFNRTLAKPFRWTFTGRVLQV
jgi:transposase